MRSVVSSLASCNHRRREVRNRMISGHGHVEFDLFDARAVGYRVLMARPGTYPGKSATWVPPASLLGCSARIAEPYQW